MLYAPRTFAIPPLARISNESVREHLTLYEGYVKNYTAITEKIAEYKKDPAAHAHALSELVRRRSFEFDGMRLHEYYFEQFEGGAQTPNNTSTLAEALNAQFATNEALIAEITNVGLMRGPGWALLYYDPVAKGFIVGFSGEQHQGHFVTLPIVLALDVWEHAYLKDYGVSDKKSYIEAFFANLNWSVLEARFERIQK